MFCYFALLLCFWLSVLLGAGGGVGVVGDCSILCENTQLSLPHSSFLSSPLLDLLRDSQRSI